VSAPRVCVVGAGVSGIAAARALARLDVPFECFDRRDRVGGACLSASPPSLDVSRERLGFSDGPVPASYPAFPGALHLADYLDGYARRFGLDAHLRLGTAVERACRTAEGRWEVDFDGGERRVYDAVVVATGTRALPRAPAAPPGSFSGVQLHSDDGRDRAALAGRDVVVAGSGTVAAEIAVEASYVARSTHLALSSPAPLVPLTVFGRPYDQLPGAAWLAGRALGLGPLSLRLPRRLRHALLGTAHRVWFTPRLYGLPRARLAWGSSRPAAAPQLLERLLHGRLAVTPAIARLEGDSARFADGTRARADTIVWCSGHRPDFPFLPAELSPLRAGGLELYRNVFPPALPDLAFVGLADPLAGSLPRIAEAQAAWVAACLAGRCALPPRERMEAACPSALGVEQEEYVSRLRTELRSGRMRSRIPRKGVLRRPGPAGHARMENGANSAHQRR
jgi:dimethylaniline monooxygenase (N-oxide forming)